MNPASIIALFLMMAAIFGVGYLNARKRVGAQAAKKRSLLGFSMMSVGLVLILGRDRLHIPAEVVFGALGWIGVIAAVLEWVAILNWPRRRRAAGEVVQDAGPHPNRNTAIMLGISAALMAVAEIMGSIDTHTINIKTVGLQVFLLSSAVAAWVIARSRVYITTEGLLRFDKQIKWSEIESYEWKRGGALDELHIRTRKRWLGRTVKLEVPVEQRPLLEQWLDREAGPARRVAADTSRKMEAHELQ